MASSDRLAKRGCQDEWGVGDGFLPATVDHAWSISPTPQSIESRKHLRDSARALIHCTADSIPDIDDETETLFEKTEWLSLFKTFLPGLVTPT